MKVTTDQGKKKQIYPRSPCFSEAYISMISESFHYMAKCFGFYRSGTAEYFLRFLTMNLLLSSTKKVELMHAVSGKSPKTLFIP